MRCPACGATNPDTAQWCGQCLTRFSAAPPPAPAPSAPAAPDAPAAPTAATTHAQPAPPSESGFRRVGDELQWACPNCEQFNAIDDVACVACGTPFVDRFRAEEAPEPPQNFNQAMALSVVAPGAGHLAIGRYGSGLARLVLFLTWLGGAILLGLGEGSGSGRAVVPLLLGVLVIWAGSLVDLYRLQHGQDELLVGQRLLWLVLGVLGLLGVALVSSAAQILG